MARAIHRTIYNYLRSVHTPDFDPADWLINPDLSGVSGVPEKYWKVSGDSVVEMSQAEKDAVDAANAPFDELMQAYSEIETQNGSSTYVIKSYLNPSNLSPTSKHKINWYCEVNNTSTSGRTQIEVAYDGNVVAEPSIESEDANDWVPFSGFAQLNAGVTPTSITLKFKRLSAGTSKVRRARLEIQRCE